MKKVDGELNLWVFGPGYGEFIVVHVPPDGWLAIDGCSAGAQLFPELFFDAIVAVPTHILLTHPHLDHARGVQRLIEASTRAATGWPRLGALMPPRSRVGRAGTQAGYDGRVANAVLSAMKTRWRRKPTCHWNPRVGSLEKLGSGTLRVLSPEAIPAQVVRAKRFDWNRVATALAVEWSGQRLILASDLVENPGGGWTGALKRMPTLRQHVVLKVAHHGSLKAQHSPVLSRLPNEPEVRMLVTPFSNEALPRFEKNEGADLLLQHTKKLYLTALPQKFEAQNRVPRQWRRSRLNQIKKPIAPDEPVGAFPSCYVRLTINAIGKTKLKYGPGSVIVHAG